MEHDGLEDTLNGCSCLKETQIVGQKTGRKTDDGRVFTMSCIIFSVNKDYLFKLIIFTTELKRRKVLVSLKAKTK